MVTIAPATAGGSVSAHTGFESSTPADGEVVDEPVELVTVLFSGEATPIGDGFVALTADGVVQEPASVRTLDDRLFTIRFDPPLAGGQIGFRWNIQAPDAHPIEGAFSFTISASVPTTLPATLPPTTVDAPPPTAASEALVPSTTGATPVPDPVVAEVTQATQTLEEFLAVDNSVPGETTARIGRVVGFLGVALGIGTLAFVATTLRGRREEIGSALFAVRVLGGIIVVGAAIEYIGVGRITAESFGSTWSTAPGFATVLRLVGGIGLLVGAPGTLPARRASAAPQALSAAVVEDHTTTRAGAVRWVPHSRSWPAFAGVALILGSFWFDGHTVSKGFRPLHALVNTVHVAAGSVWVGGVVALAVVGWTRHRSGVPTRAAELVVQFSRIATIALAAVLAAGVVMAILVLDSFGELTGTPWGKILLLKSGAVGLAIAGGAYNHFRLEPALDADPESPELQAELRSTVTAEAIMLVFVVVVTAWLVEAAS